jgi:hypothetical protein
MGRPIQIYEMLLQPQMVLERFEKWATNVLGPINPPSHWYSYILVCTHCFTKWMEAKALPEATEHTVVEFLHEEIFARFGIPREIVTEGGTQFTSWIVRDLMNNYKIKHKVITPYHPQ